MASYTIKNMWVSPSKYNIKSPYAMNPTTITIHETDNNAHPENEANYMRNNNLYTSWHAAFGDKLVVQTLPFNRNGWAAGDGASGPGNRTSIHFEICYNKDNGYNGPMSARMIKAIDNCALYTAHVLIQFGWGTDRLRRHWDWTRKHCPRKIIQENKWNGFKRQVQSYMDEIRGVKKKAPAKKKSSTQKASGSTYTVRKNDSLWAIGKANGVSVANLKKWNDLDSNIIHVGQNLRVKAPAKKSSSKGKGTGGVENIKYKADTWSTNRHGTHYVAVDATFIVGSEPIYVYDDSPFLNLANRAPSRAQPGARIKVKELARQDGHVWAGYYTGSGQWRYIPIKKWNGGGGRVTNKGLWGRFH